MSTLTSIVGNRACRDKAIAKSMMRFAGVPTAPALRMPHKGTKSAMRFVELHGWPVVVKPLNGQGGKGVTANITSEEELRLAIKGVDSPMGFLIEKHVGGEDYRFLVAGEEVIGVWRRDAANVMGDGRSSLDELIDSKNEIRGTNPHLATRPIKKDALVLNHLKRSGLTLEYVPSAGEKIYLRSAANLSSGGDNIEITDETHPSLKAIAVRAKQTLPSIELVGVDILLEDYTLPASDQEVNICELNSMPGISAHDFPMYGKPRTAAARYLEILAAGTGVSLKDTRKQSRFLLTSYGQFNENHFADHLASICNRAGVKLLDVEGTPDRYVADLEGEPFAMSAVHALSLAPSARVGRVEGSEVKPEA
nr:hypothetical protein [Leucobacter sp. Psy1]